MYNVIIMTEFHQQIIMHYPSSPLTIITISPLGVFIVKYSLSSFSVPQWNVSNFFDISLATHASLSSPNASASWRNVRGNLTGLSYMMTLRVSCASCPRRVARPFFSGRKPSNTNLSQGSPLPTRAGTNAVAPGSTVTSIPAFLHSLTSINPGSEIPGVPASEIRAMFSPPSSLSVRCFTVACSLYL